MKRIVVAAIIVIGGSTRGGTQAPNVRPPSESDRLRAAIDSAGQPATPADTAFRRAREVLNAGQTERAAQLFGDVVEKWPSAAVAPDALYWRAYALYRYGTERQRDEALREAQVALNQRIINYPVRTAIPDAQLLQDRIAAARGGRSVAYPAWTSPLQTLQDGAGTVYSTRGGVNLYGQPTLARSVDLTATANTGPGRGSARVARSIVDVPSGPDCVPFDQDQRMVGIENLARTGAPAGESALRELARFTGKCAERMRAMALTQLSLMASPNALSTLLTAAGSDPSTGVRAAAFAGVGRVPGRESLAALDSVVRRSTDPTARLQALQAVVTRTDPGVDSLLRGVATDPAMPGELRRLAGTRVSIRPPSAESRISPLFIARVVERTVGRSEREWIRMAAADTTPGALDSMLVRVVLDQRQAMADREIASNHLALRRSVASARLAELVDQVNGLPILQPRLIRHLAARGDTVAMDKVVAIARTGPSSWAGRTAIDVLVASRDPRAVEVLLELIRNPPDPRR